MELVDWRFAEATMHDLREEYAAACNLFSEVLDINPDHVGAITGLGRLYVHRRHVKQDPLPYCSEDTKQAMWRPHSIWDASILT